MASFAAAEGLRPIGDAHWQSTGVSGTPTVFINGLRLVGVYPLEMIREAVQDALDDATGKRP